MSVSVQMLLPAHGTDIAFHKSSDYKHEDQIYAN